MRPEDLERILKSKPPAPSQLDALNDRELELFSILGQGYSQGQIQSEFAFKPAELNALRKSILAKLGLRSDAQLRRLAQEHASAP